MGGSSVQSLKNISCGLLLLVALAGTALAGDDLKIVVLDSSTGHALRGKLVCIIFPVSNPADPVVERPRECRRTDSAGTAAFPLPDPMPAKVEVFFSTNGLIPCFSPHTVVPADAMGKGMVMDNTCGDASTDTTETGEVILFAHQKTLREAMESVRNEF
jgi:hypothetical protein